MDGGFCCVAGFHKSLKKWAHLLKDSSYAKKNSQNYEFVNFPRGGKKKIFFFFFLFLKIDPCIKQAQKIPMRAGSFVVWSSELPHANFPNFSSNFRFNQYIRMFPAQPEAVGIDLRVKSMNELLKWSKCESLISELGKKLLGLKAYSE